jgi:hypothetical protein
LEQTTASINGDNVTFEVQTVQEPSIEPDMISGALLLLCLYARRTAFLKIWSDWIEL